MTVQKSVRAVLLRELDLLQRELEAFEDETLIWSLPSGIRNSSGTLTLHLTGNLQAFVGAALGGSGYARDRRAEFERRDVPRAELLRLVESTIAVVNSTLMNLESQKLAEPFPISLGNLEVTTGDFLLHLATHLAFHLGQIDYHRRLVTGEDSSLDPVRVAELPSAAATE